MKRGIKTLLAMGMVLSLLAGCGGQNKAGADSGQPAQDNKGSGKTASGDNGDGYTGISAIEACEWAADKYPDAKVIRYTNNTSSNTFDTNGGAIPAMVLHLAKELPLRTDGRYRLELYADGTLAKTVDDIVSGLKSGAFEMNCLSIGNFGDYTNAFSEMNIPFFFSNEEQVRGILEAGLTQDMCSRAESDIEGVIFKGIAPFGFRQMTNNKKEIVAPSDLKGLKMRILTDPLQVAAFETMGASVTNVTYSELYTALQQGVVDGEENPYQNLYVDKLCEVQKYCTETNHLFQMSVQVISKNFWDGLTPEDQEIFETLIAEAEEKGYERVNELNQFYKDECEKTGMQVRILTDEELAAFNTMMEESVHEKAVAIMGQDRWDKLNQYLSDQAAK